jgi:DNA polymerase III subunit chi
MMKNKIPVKAIFHRVSDNGAKIQFVCSKAQEALQHEKRLLIAVPNFQAAQYVDLLLWQHPAESFLPHVIAEATTPESIAITMQQQHNVNQATWLLNLCPTPSALYQYVEEVYDLYDESHPQKTELSRQRMGFYEAKGLVILRHS